jgi:hypothetical protein
LPRTPIADRGNDGDETPALATEKTRQVAGGEVTVTPIELIAETAAIS